MTGFNDTMRRREKAEEDVYFARLDRQLIAALRGRVAPDHDSRKGTEVAGATDPGAPLLALAAMGLGGSGNPRPDPNGPGRQTPRT